MIEMSRNFAAEYLGSRNLKIIYSRVSSPVRSDPSCDCAPYVFDLPTGLAQKLIVSHTSINDWPNDIREDHRDRDGFRTGLRRTIPAGNEVPRVARVTAGAKLARGTRALGAMDDDTQWPPPPRPASEPFGRSMSSGGFLPALPVPMPSAAHNTELLGLVQEFCAPHEHPPRPHTVQARP